eukprot:CCRYP_021204-RA/>CCRYP_021204-RA protein AED:0.29 eAED:0.29 QI:0/0/0/1/0/0/2/0/118
MLSELQLPLSRGQVELPRADNPAGHHVRCMPSCQVHFANPRHEHGKAIVCIVKYLKATRHIGLCFKPDAFKGFQCYCNADFAGNWNNEFAETDPSTAKSRRGWVVFYAACPVIWASKL